MFTNSASSKGITSGAATVKRAATAIRAVLSGQEAFMRTFADEKQHRANLSETEVDALRAAVQILEKLHDKRSEAAKTAAEEERAFKAREAAARIEAAKIFDGWKLDVGGWLPLVADTRGLTWILRDVREGIVALGWCRDCDYARDHFLTQIAWEIASGKGGVADLMQARREKLAASAARECQDVDALVQQITTALVALQLTRANAKAGQK